MVPTNCANEAPDVIHPIAFARLVNGNDSPAMEKDMPPIIADPTPSKGKKISRNKKFGANAQPITPIGMQRAPIKSKVLSLNLKLNKARIIPAITAAALDIAPIWLMIAIYIKLVEPKKVAVKSSKNRPIRKSKRKTEKNVSVNAKTSA